MVGVAVFLLHGFARWYAATVWDDAFIFQRYATNLSAGDGVTFNPGGSPTYGLTALLYLGPVAVVRLAVDDPVVASLVTSASCALLALGLLARLAFKAAEGGSTGWLAVAAIAAVAASPISADHAVSGMDTWFGVAYLAALLWTLHSVEVRSGSWGRAGVMAGLALWVRPELAIFGAMAALFLFVRAGPTRIVGLKLGLTILAVSTGLMMVAWAYFDVPLPLPFFTKASGVYGPGFQRVYRGRGWSELGIFLAQVWPLLIPSGLEFAGSPRRWWGSAGAVERGVAVASVFLLLFHALVAIPVMGMGGRFYQPLLPASVYLASRSLARLREKAPEETTRWWPSVVVGANLLLWTQMLPTAGAALTAAGNRAQHGLRTDARGLAKEKGPRRYWPGLEHLPELPPMTIAATEVGFVGVVAPEQRIIDIAGLNTKAFAFGPFDVDHLVEDIAPELIYLPHPDYKRMTSTLLAHEGFKRRYVQLRRQQVHGSHYGVAVRRDSPHAKRLLAALRKPVAFKLHRRATAYTPP